jgi:hypothetical protein
MKTLIAAALLGLLSACSLLPTDGGPKSVRTGREFTLDEGRRAVLMDPRLAVEFDGVLEDMRCPVEANCVAPGHAVVRLSVSQPGHAPATFDLRTDQPNAFAAYHEHAIVLVGLDPARSTAGRDPDYRVRLVIGPLYTGGR